MDSITHLQGSDQEILLRLDILIPALERARYRTQKMDIVIRDWGIFPFGTMYQDMGILPWGKLLFIQLHRLIIPL